MHSSFYTFLSYGDSLKKIRGSISLKEKHPTFQHFLIFPLYKLTPHKKKFKKHFLKKAPFFTYILFCFVFCVMYILFFVGFFFVVFCCLFVCFGNGFKMQVPLCSKCRFHCIHNAMQITCWIFIRSSSLPFFCLPSSLTIFSCFLLPSFSPLLLNYKSHTIKSFPCTQQRVSFPPISVIQSRS